MKINVLVAGLLMLASACVLAAGQPTIVVEGVQMPAWVEHSTGQREPLAVSMRLDNKDRIYTGPGSRALLRLADGSLIKLGENGLLALDDLGQKKVQLKDVVTASLDVIGGAFRFTTQALNRFRGERDVKVRISNVTAGIRGTDVWGKADKDRDIVCLIEGNITVARAGSAFTMDQPKSYYIAPKQGEPLPVASVSQEQIDQWALETEIAPGTGAARKAGKWRVYLAQVPTQSEALAFYDQLRAAGYAAEIRPLKQDNAFIYRLRISNLPSRADAAVLAAQVTGKFGVTQTKVSK